MCMRVCVCMSATSCTRNSNSRMVACYRPYLVAHQQRARYVSGGLLRTALVTLPCARPSARDFPTTHPYRTTRSISVCPKVITNLWSPPQLSSRNARRCRMFESCY